MATAIDLQALATADPPDARPPDDRPRLQLVYWKDGDGVAREALVSPDLARALDSLERSDRRRDRRHRERQAPFTDLERPGKNGDVPPSFANGIVDSKAVDPLEAVAVAEQAARLWRMREALEPRKKKLAVSLPRPSVILGVRPQWAGDWHAGDPCPGCRGRKLSALEYCCVDGCERSGLDNFLFVPESERPKVYQPDPEGQHLTGGTGKARGGKVGTGTEQKKPGKRRKRGRKG